MGQQHYLSQSPRGNGGNGGRGPNGPPGNDRNYPHRSGGGRGGPHGAPAGDDWDPPDIPYGGDSDSSFSSEFGRWHRYDWCTQQQGQFEKGMTAMNNLWSNYCIVNKRHKMMHQSQ